VLGARRRAKAVRIDVIDTGVGIGDDDRARVFDEFVQLAAAPRHHAAGRGMGLGLAIVRRLAALLGHRIDLASMPGRGSRFSIIVPRAILPRQRTAPTRKRDEPPATESRALEGRCVVVVDDDPAVVGAMGALFASWKAMATGGADADSALAALSTIGRCGRNGVDLVIADLRLADGRSGIDAIARLREALGPGTPALIVSGDTSGNAQAEALAAGIRLLLKPVVAGALKDAAEATLRARTDTCVARSVGCPQRVFPA
jgi:hypothetical protein